MRVIITGGSGLIGRTTMNLLASAGHEVVILSRRPERVTELPHGAKAQGWDAKTGEGWAELVNANTVIVNLAGESLFHWRWTKRHKKNVMESRLAAARAVVDAIRRSRRTPRLVIQASAVGYYGDRGDESSPSCRRPAKASSPTCASSGKGRSPSPFPGAGCSPASAWSSAARGVRSPSY